MPTGRQIRAARMLADWLAEELATKIDMSRESVQQIERGETRPRTSTIEKIVRVFNDAGIEFIGEAGVIQKEEQLVRITGENVFFKILDDVIATCRNSPEPEVLFACVEDRLSPPVVIENYKRLRKEGIGMRSLVKEGDTYLMGKLEEYRFLAKNFFHNNPMVIYGNKVAFMIYPEVKSDKMAIVITNPHTAATMRNFFEFIWQHSNAPTRSTAEEHYD